MDAQPAQKTSSPNAPTHSPPALPVTSESALEAEFKARIEEIEWQRDEESAAMCDRLYFLVMEYKRRDQSFVDRHTEYLEQLSRRLPAVAKTRSWATPCRGVADREVFSQGGIAIKFHPSPRIGQPPPHGDNAERETVTTWKLPSSTAATDVEHSRFRSLPSSSSPLSSVRSLSEPTSNLVTGTSETRARKHPKRPPSPDELAFDLGAGPAVVAGQTTKGSRIPHNKPRRKPIMTYGREKLSTQSMQSTQPTQPTQSTELAQSTQPTQSTQSSSTPMQHPSSIFPAPRPTLKVNRRIPCLECRKRRVRCSRGKPRCSRCEKDGKLCGYQVP